MGSSVSCSAQTKPTHHLPPNILALPHTWHPDSPIPRFALHCKTSPVNKQAVSGSVHVWRGHLGLWRRTGRSSSSTDLGRECRCVHLPLWLKGWLCHSPMQLPVAWKGKGTKPAHHLKQSHHNGQLTVTETTPPHPQQTWCPTAGAISAPRLIDPAHGVHTGQGWREAAGCPCSCSEMLHWPDQREKHTDHRI